MTEGLQGFDAFNQAIQALEQAAGGGGSVRTPGAAGGGLYMDENGRWRDPSQNPNGTTIHGTPTPDPLYNPTTGRTYDPIDETYAYDEDEY